VNADEVLFADIRVALIESVGGAAIAEKMFCRRCNRSPLQQPARTRLALQAQHHRFGVLPYQIRDLRVSFVRTAPPIILRHGEGRTKCPVDAGRRRFRRGRCADTTDQIRIARGAQSDVVRKDRGPDRVVVTVHGVDAEDHGNRRVAGTFLHGDFTKGAGRFDPCLRLRTILAAQRRRVAAGQDRTQRVLPQIARLDGRGVGLDHLADLFFQRHLGHQLGHERFGRRIDETGTASLWPTLRMSDAALARLRLGGQRRGGDQC
jgi:hypothetical protein